MSVLPPSVLLLTCVGLTLSTTFTVGSLSFTYFAIPAILLPSSAPLIPPLELVAERRKRHFRTEPAPKQPLDSGVGDEKETLLDAGATEQVTTNDNGSTDQCPSSSSYLLRQWFHLFSKGMHVLPPCTIGSAVCFASCAFLVPGTLQQLQYKRGLYAAAAALNFGAMVFTLTALKPTNAALHKRIQQVVADEKKENISSVNDKRQETEALIRKWGKMNSVRAILPVLAAVCAVVGLVL